MASVKWLTGITAVQEPFEGFQQTVYRFRQNPTTPASRSRAIHPRSLIIPPGIPDFLTRRRFVEPGRHLLRGRVVRMGADRAGRGQHRRLQDVDRRDARRIRVAVRLGAVHVRVGRVGAGCSRAVLPRDRRRWEHAAARAAVELPRVREQRRASHPRRGAGSCRVAGLWASTFPTPEGCRTVRAMDPSDPPTRLPSIRPDLRPGTEFAGYRIERILGRGGMSVVYLAEHVRLERKVAVKVLAPAFADDMSFRERFVRESRMAASSITRTSSRSTRRTRPMGCCSSRCGTWRNRPPHADPRTGSAGNGAGGHHRRAGGRCARRRTGRACPPRREAGNVLLAERGSQGIDHVYLSEGLTKRAASDSGR